MTISAPRRLNDRMGLRAARGFPACLLRDRRGGEAVDETRRTLRVTLVPRAFAVMAKDFQSACKSPFPSGPAVLLASTARYPQVGLGPPLGKGGPQSATETNHRTLDDGVTEVKRMLTALVQTLTADT